MEVGNVLPEIEVEAIRVHADPEALRAAFMEVASNAFDLFFSKGGDYDKQLPYWHRHPFGDASYGHETFKKSGRAVSIVLGENITQFEGLDEQIDDIINYAVMWRHWRSITDRSGKTQKASRYDTELQSQSPLEQPLRQNRFFEGESPTPPGLRPPLVRPQK